MNKNFFKATGRAAKITGKDVKELRKHFNKKATDAPADSGWRPGEPVGVWDQNYYRKHVYAGIADGLSGE